MRRALFAGSVAAITCGLVFACTLDLDESLISKGPRDGAPVTIGDVTLPDGTVISDSGVPITPDTVTCAKDGDCIATNKCLTPKCDLTRKACVYDICHSTACSVGVCDQAAKTCSGQQTYKKTVELTLDQVTTGGIIAAYPWLFQMTSTGILVYDISNPTKLKPTAVPLVGVGFVPNQFVRSGNRIWIGAPLAGTPARLPIAYIDVPVDPFTAKIEAHSILANYNRPATESVGFLPSENKGAIVVGPAPQPPPAGNGTGYATALLDTLLAEPATKTATPVTPKDNTVLIAASGSRLVMQAIAPLTGAVTNQFGLISGVGTTTPVVGDLVTVGEMTGQSQFRTWGQNVDGTTFLVTGVNGAGPAPDTTVSVSARGYFLVKDGKSPIDAGAKGMALENYTPANAPGANAEVARGITMFDSDTFAVPLPASENPATSIAIQFVKSAGTVDVGKRVVLTQPLGALAGTSASDGILYVAVNAPTGVPDTAPTPKLFVVDPACSP